MAGSLFGLGAGTPSRFPYGNRPQPAPGVGPGASNTVRARKVIVSGANGGVFIYDPAPGPGTLVKSITDENLPVFADPYGNPVIPGDTSYRPGSVAFGATAASGLVWYFWTGSAWAQSVAMDLINPTIGGYLKTSGAGGASSLVFPSGDGTGTTDRQNINSALTAGACTLAPGQYFTDAPIVVPSYTTLECLAGPMSLGPGTPPAPGVSQPRIVPVAAFAGAAAITMTAAVSAAVRGVILDCSQLPGAVINGIGMSGACYDVHLEDVYVYSAPHNGVVTAGTHMRFERVSCADSGNFGANVTNATDSSYTDCLMFASHGANWSISNCSNSIWTGCRAEWSATGSGWSVSGASGSIVFTGCSTDQNNGTGLSLNGVLSQATDGGGVIWAGGKIHADGHDLASAGIRVQSCTAPVTISGVNVEAGVNAGNTVPGTAVNITGSTSVSVGDSVLQGQASAWNAPGPGVICRSGCVGATGNIGAQVYARLADI